MSTIRIVTWMTLGFGLFVLGSVASAAGMVGGVGGDKTKPAERRGRKATGPRVLRRVRDDPAEGPKTAEPPKLSSISSVTTAVAGRLTMRRLR